jgi:hypothetical protein
MGSDLPFEPSKRTQMAWIAANTPGLKVSRKTGNQLTCHKSTLVNRVMDNIAPFHCRAGDGETVMQFYWSVRNQTINLVLDFDPRAPMGSLYSIDKDWESRGSVCSQALL